MKFPFVSRDRLEAVQDQLRISEVERHTLMDRLAMLRGEPPLFSKPEASVASASVAPSTDTLHVVAAQEPVKGAPKVLANSATFDHVLNKAAEAVRENRVGKTRIS